MNGLESNVAIITGGARSIGRTVTESLHKAGVKVIIADWAEGAGQNLASALGDGALFIKTDVANDHDLVDLVDATIYTYGRIDFIVNVAAIYDDAGLNSTREQWRRSLDINVASMALLVQFAYPYLCKSNSASVVNFGSISATAAQAARWTYPVSKSAIHQLTRNMALDLATDGVRVNTLCPGITWSKPVAGLVDGHRDVADEVCARYQPLGRAADSEEIADGVLFLCSSHSRFITGTELKVDGGYSALGPEARESSMEAMMAAGDRRLKGD